MLPREVFEGMLTETRERVDKKIEAVDKLIKHLKECHGSEAIGKAEHYPKNPFNYTERFCFFCKEKRPDISASFNFFLHIRRDHAEEIKYHEDYKDAGGKFVCPFCSSFCY